MVEQNIRKDIFKIVLDSSLNEFLLTRCLFIKSPERISELLSDGRLLLNNKIISSQVDLKRGDELVLLSPQSLEPVVQTDYSLIYEDDYLFAINKPPFLPVHPAGKFYFNTLTMLLQSDGRSPDEMFPLNRLDKETSGIVLFAKSKTSASRFHVALKDSSTKKEYLALVKGVPSLKSGVISIPLEKKSLGPIRNHMHVLSDGSLSAKTSYVLLSYSPDSLFSLLSVVIHSGRRHQIRAHLAHIGHPIVGDKQYSVSPSLFDQYMSSPFSDSEVKRFFLFNRQLLHCQKISFIHPFIKDLIEIKSTLSGDFKSFIEKNGLFYSLNY